MHNFPSEYLYVDVEGNLFHKRYSERKTKCSLTPFMLASIPVIISKDATINTIFKLVEKEPALQSICFYAKEFIAESKKESTITTLDDCHINFYWDSLELNQKYFNVAYPKVEVEGIDKNGQAFSIEFLKACDIKNLKMSFSPALTICNENYEKVHEVELYPTLFHIVYGLFWEMSFFGDPATRDEEGKKIRELLSNVVKENENA